MTGQEIGERMRMTRVKLVKSNWEVVRDMGMHKVDGHKEIWGSLVIKMVKLKTGDTLMKEDGGKTKGKEIAVRAGGKSETWKMIIKETMEGGKTQQETGQI